MHFLRLCLKFFFSLEKSKKVSFLLSTNLRGKNLLRFCVTSGKNPWKLFLSMRPNYNIDNTRQIGRKAIHSSCYIFGLSNKIVFLRVSESVVVLMIDFFSVRLTKMKDTWQEQKHRRKGHTNKVERQNISQFNFFCNKAAVDNLESNFRLRTSRKTSTTRLLQRSNERKK